MNSEHPLVQAAWRFLHVARQEAVEYATQLGEPIALLHRDHLRVSTHFSGMGGGELSAFLVAKAVGLPVRLVSQCDITPESMAATGFSFVKFLFRCR